MKNYGLFGEHLSHSKSPEIQKYIYNLIGYDADYNLYEFPKGDLSNYINRLKNNSLDGVNVTIPYKKDVIEYLDVLDPKAKDIAAVNTIVRKNGLLYGYNTDYYGIEKTLETFDPVENKDCLILGYGGASQPLIHFLADKNAKTIYIASRKSEKYKDFKLKNSNIVFLSYEELKNIQAYIIFNSTPVGMYPNDNTSPVGRDVLSNFSIAIDFIYNPSCTKFLSYAKECGLKTQNGLKMLVYQALKSIEIWKEEKIEENKQMDTYLHFRSLLQESDSICLIGLPASGKSTLGKMLADYIGYDFIDLDSYIEDFTMMSIEDIFEIHGENYFREIESRLLADLIKKKDTVISPGGGIVLRENNRDLLRKCDKVFYIKRDCEDILNNVNLDNRPLLKSSPQKIYELYNERHLLYENLSNYALYNNSSLENLLLEALLCF